MIRRLFIVSAFGLLSGLVASQAAFARDEARAARYPNEPAGFTPWFEHDWKTFSTIRDAWPMPASEAGYFTPVGWSHAAPRLANYELVEDPDGPHGMPGYLRIRVPTGQEFGHGVGSWSVQSSPAAPANDDGGHIELGKAYISFWAYFEPNPIDGTWDIPNFAWRIFTVNRHADDACAGSSDIGLSVRGPRGYNASFNHFWLWGYPDCESRFTTLAQSAPGATVGQWYHVEILWERLTGSMRNGDEPGTSHFTMWVDGELRFEGERAHKMGRPFRQLHVNTNPSGSWHGGERFKQRDDYLRYTGLYVSGVALP